jgi:predicted type IV restriction endonuclease
MPIPASILERIETFRRNLDSYLKPDYKEAQVRQEFIDPLFAALGWDVSSPTIEVARPDYPLLG